MRFLKSLLPNSQSFFIILYSFWLFFSINLMFYLYQLLHQRHQYDNFLNISNKIFLIVNNIIMPLHNLPSYPHIIRVIGNFRSKFLTNLEKLWLDRGNMEQLNIFSEDVIISSFHSLFSFNFFPLYMFNNNLIYFPSPFNKAILK